MLGCIKPMPFFYFTLHARCCNQAASHESNANLPLEIKRREALVVFVDCHNPLNKFYIPTRSLKTITGSFPVIEYMKNRAPLGSWRQVSF